jgi:hypothetical protein
VVSVAGILRSAGIAGACAALLGCGGGRLGPAPDAGIGQATPDAGAPDAPNGFDARIFIDAPLLDAGQPIVDAGGPGSRIDGPVLTFGSGAEAVVTSARCEAWSRAAPDAGSPPGGGAAGWARQFVEGASLAVSVDGQGRITLLSRHAREVDFGSGPVTAPEGQLCGLLSSFTADGAHRWSRGIAGAGSSGRVASWPDGDVALLLPTAVVRFDADGAARWARQFDTAPRTITPQNDGSLILVTEWIQQQGARLIVMRLSSTGDLLSEFSFDDHERASFVAASPAGDVFLIENRDSATRSFSVTRVDATGGALFWSKTFAASGFTKCHAAAATPEGGLVVSGWSSSDADFGGGPILPGAQAVSFAASFNGQGQHLVSRAFGDSATLTRAVARPGGGVVIADNFAGKRTFDGTVVHTGSNGDRDFLLLELDAALRVTRVARFGNGGGEQLLSDLALAPDGAALVAGFFQTKLDLGWGLMRTAGYSDAFLARLTKESPAPGVAPSEGEPALPPDFTAPAPPQWSCDPTAPGTICDLPASQCPIPKVTDAGMPVEPSWLAYYENPRCVLGTCVWDQRYFRCPGTWACMSGLCVSTTLAATAD